MQIIQGIRKRAAIATAAIAIAIIGFILLDARNGSSRLFSGNNDVLGKVNGQTIDYTDFNARVKEMEDQYGDRATGMTNQLQQNVWDQIITEDVLSGEFEKLDMNFSPKELSDILFSENAPQAWKQLFTDKTTGQYDISKAEQGWAQVKKLKGEQRQEIEREIIDPMKLQALYTKYSGLISAGGYYPTWMQQRDNAENKAFANISYVAVPYSVINDSSITVSDDDINDYVKNHSAKYKQDGGRVISYVAFSTDPSSQDTANTLQSLLTLKPQFAVDTNAKAFVSRNMSATDFDDFFTVKSKITSPYKDSILALSKDGIYGPYLDGKNYTMAKMLDSRQLPDSVKCRHILIATQDPQSGQEILADSTAKQRIDSIAAAIKGGASFDSMVLKYTDDPGSKDKKGVYDFTSSQFGSLAKEFAETIFYGNTGDKKVVHTIFGWHYIEVMDQKDFQPAYKIAYMAKEILSSDETVDSAESEATKLSGQARDSKAFDAYVSKNGIRKTDVPAIIKESDYQLGALQDARQVIKWAFGAKEGEVSEPLSVGDQFVVAVLEKIVPKGLPDAVTARPMVEVLVRNLKKADQIISKLGNAPTLQSAASAYNKSIQTAGADSSLLFTSPILNGVGQEPKLIGAAFNADFQSAVSPPITGANGVYIIKVNSIGTKPADPQTVTDQQNTFRGMSYMRNATGGWMESLKKEADIKDNRSKFF